VGAAPIDGDPVYLPLTKNGQCKITGFEPSPEMFAQLPQDETHKYYPWALGDGKAHMLNICKYPGMTSIFKPDKHVLVGVLDQPDLSEILRSVEIETKRMDDIPMDAIDFLKMDIQGAELMVLQNAIEKLKDVLVIHIEVNFIPFYENQPLFGDIDLFLRSQGFIFHKFSEMHQTQSQMYWADAVYIRPFEYLKTMDIVQLSKIIRIVHEVYQAYDIVDLCFKELDRRMGTNYRVIYKEMEK
jgi:FkbM family methyltransferase